MKAIQGLNPQNLWRSFWEISQIPRESGNESAVADYICKKAQGLGLNCRIDTARNVFEKTGRQGLPSFGIAVAYGYGVREES